MGYTMPEKGPPIQSVVRRPRPEPEPMDLSIVYEDDSLVAVDKPPGMVVHPTYKNWSGTLLNGLLWHVRHRALRPAEGVPSAATVRPGSSNELRDAGIEPSIVTRLDKDTSGLVLVALRPELHARIQRDAAAGRVKKEYLAIVRGTPTPPRGAIALPLARSPLDRRRVIVDEAGQHSETEYELLSTWGEDGTALRRAQGVVSLSNGECPPHHGRYSLVRCALVTGRTHQIRVHLAARGWPVAGDRVYGEPHPALTRQALHAWRLTLPHPVTRQLLELEAPLPADLQRFPGSDQPGGP